jgi:hypothetical protein
LVSCVSVLASIVCAHARTADAGSCALPTAFAIAVEYRGGIGNAGLVATASAPAAGLAAGDLVRQANGMRVEQCADLERAAAEALSKGLALLLAVERDGRLMGVAVTTPEHAERVAAARRAPPSSGAEAPSALARETRRDDAMPEASSRTAVPDGAASEVPPAPAPALSPQPWRELSLPSASEASPDARRHAAAAATALASVDASAALSVPVVLYERRLGDAEAAIATVGFALEGADDAVRRFVGNVLSLHRTARDVRRAKLELLSQSGVDRRASSATSLPYFSESRVPEWVATYPFLHVVVITPPRETRMPVRGEVAGRWNPDRALELLWGRARQATGQLADWSRSE